MRAADIIRKKRDGLPLQAAEIEAFVAGATGKGGPKWPDYQLSALLMAVVLRGMDARETADLTLAMVRSGTVLDWSDLPGVPVDKHSTGGVGDKTSLVLVPLAAACGVLVPKMSGRSLGHSGGTLDKLEAIPGFRVRLTVPEMREVLRKTGCAMVGQTANLVPADRVLYALRDVTATVESLPLIAASVTCKKLAEGIRGLVLDVKCGSGAFMKTREEAAALARVMVDIATANGVRTVALLTPMDRPLGRAAGNALEVRESIAVLAGYGPADVRGLAAALAARMVHLAGQADTLADAGRRVEEALTSGRALEVFRQLVEAQGGDPRVVDDPDLLPSCPGREVVRAARPGVFQGVEAEALGRAVMLLGAGRDHAEDVVDPGVGAVLLADPGDHVNAGDGLVELHYRDANRLPRARALVEQACAVADSAAESPPLVLEVVE